jgi:hypothetical protein
MHALLQKIVVHPNYEKVSEFFCYSDRGYEETNMQVKIKLVFICGGLELGKDGVGDYVRKIGLELIRQGHSVIALSINDSFITEIYREKAYDHGLAINRIPSSLPEVQRFKLAKDIVDEFGPDWVSLQFVIFSFHLKGLPIHFSMRFKQLIKKTRLHIMFHELWVGMSDDSTMRHRFWGYIQRAIIRNLVRKLRPDVVSTQNVLYQTILSQNAIESFHLPLFGNIENHANHSDHVQIDKVKDLITIVTFGTIHPDSLIDQFAKEASMYCKMHSTNMHMVLVGRCGREQEEFSRIWSSYGFTVEILGEQNEEIISKRLSSATFGLSTTTYAMIEKSGTVAAMIEHYLPVLCIARLWTKKGIQNLKAPQGIFQYHPGNLKSWIDNLAFVKFEPQNVTKVALEFINHLL